MCLHQLICLQRQPNQAFSIDTYAFRILCEIVQIYVLNANTSGNMLLVYHKLAVALARA